MVAVVLFFVCAQKLFTYKMMHICVICSLGRPPLLPLAIEHRQLLEAIVSPYITTADLNACYLLLCMDCQSKMLTIHHFQKMALNGVRNLKYLLWKMTFTATVQDNRKTNTSKQIKNGWSPVIPGNSAIEMINTEPELTSPVANMDFVSVPAPRDSNLLTEEVHLKCEPEPEPDSKFPVPQPYLEPDFEMEYQPEFDPTPQIEFKCKPEPQPETDFEFQTQPQCNSHTAISIYCESTKIEQNFEPHAQDRSNSENQHNSEPERSATITEGVKKSNIACIKAKVVDKANETTESDAAAVAAAKKEKIRQKNRNRKKPERVPCPHCDKIISNKCALRNHYYRVHADRKPVKCEVCGKQCRNNEVLRIHKYYNHKRNNEPKQEFFCEECSYRCSTKATYKLHLMSLKHMPREQYKFECEVCKMKFPIERRLREHIDYVHWGLKKFKCENCEESYAHSSGLSNHVRRVHKKHVRQKTLICDLCGKAFWIKKTLADHLLAHQGLRPYKCKLCPADFSYSAALYTHNQFKHLKKKRKEKKKEKIVEETTTDRRVRNGDRMDI